ELAAGERAFRHWAGDSRNAPQSIEEIKKQMREDEARRAELRLRFDDPRRQVHEHGTCVVFGHEDGGTMGTTTYLCADGTWTKNRSQAARCLDIKEARQLCKHYNISTGGGEHLRDACCDMLPFRRPEDYKRWVDRMGTDDDEPPPFGFYRRAAGF